MPTFDAREFARAWLSVNVAAGKDLNPVLDRTIAIELHARPGDRGIEPAIDGARLIATDRRILLMTWVPTLDSYNAGPPPLDEAPYLDTVATDIDGRAASLCAYAVGLTSDDGYTVGDLELELAIDRHRPAGDPGQNGNGLPLPDERRYVSLELPDVERVWLRQLVEDYPQWRRLVRQHVAKTTKAVALDPAVLGKLAKLAKYHPAELPLLWHFGGPDRTAWLELAGSDPLVEGLVMPVRWSFDEQQVIEEAEKITKTAPDPVPAGDAPAEDDGGDGR